MESTVHSQSDRALALAHSNPCGANLRAPVPSPGCFSIWEAVGTVDKQSQAQASDDQLVTSPSVPSASGCVTLRQGFATLGLGEQQGSLWEP